METCKEYCDSKNLAEHFWIKDFRISKNGGIND